MKQTQTKQSTCKRYAYAAVVIIGLFSGYILGNSKLQVQKNSASDASTPTQVHKSIPSQDQPPAAIVPSQVTPHNFGARYSEFKDLLDKGKVDELLDRLTDYYRETQDPSASTEIAMIYWHEKNDRERAKIWLQQSAKKKPSDVNTLHELVNLHGELGSLQSELLPFLQDLPMTTAVDTATADALSRLGKNKEARPLLERHEDLLEPQQLTQLAMLKNLDGDSAGSDALKIQAWEKFRASVDERTRSEDTLYRYQALVILNRNGDLDQVSELLQEVLIDNPDKSSQFSSMIDSLQAHP